MVGATLFYNDSSSAPPLLRPGGVGDPLFAHA
jgi:hypothetical protein